MKRITAKTIVPTRSCEDKVEKPVRHAYGCLRHLNFILRINGLQAKFLYNLQSYSQHEARNDADENTDKLNHAQLSKNCWKWPFVISLYKAEAFSTKSLINL